MINLNKGDVIVGDKKPNFEDIRGDRRDGMLLMAISGRGSSRMHVSFLAGEPNGDLVFIDGMPLDDTKKVENRLKVLSYEYHNKHSGFWRRPAVVIERTGTHEGGAIKMPMPSSRSLFECALSFIWSCFMPCKNSEEFGIWQAFNSREFESIAHAIKMSDWDWIDTNEIRWWDSINISEINEINELARCAFFWHKRFPDTHKVRGEEEPVF